MSSPKGEGSHVVRGVSSARWVRRAARLAVGLLAVVACLGITPGSAGAAADPVRAVLRFERAATDQAVAALANLGLTVQPLRHLPLAIAEGSPASYAAALDRGLVDGVYEDEALPVHSADSGAAIGADVAHDLGYTGEGVVVAVVDTGVDGTHPDLDGRLVRNVKVVTPEDVPGAPGEPALMVPVDMLPYDNSDIGGHGTTVSLVAVGEGTTHQAHVGIAPGADLVAYAAGAGLSITTSAMLVAFDDILATHDELGIRVVNLSAGPYYQLFDPDDPINVATRALYDAGITVVVAAGNAGGEMTSNRLALAPWVVSVGATSNIPAVTEDSSRGLRFDNSTAVAPDGSGHLHVEGDGLGLSHPDVSAPGERVLVPFAATAPGPQPHQLLVNGTASGTSFSAPHVAGVVALVLQARPELTVDQVLQVLQVTAAPMRDRAGFHEGGYGMVDAARAIQLVTSPGFTRARLDAFQDAADRQVLAARDHRVVRGDYWTFSGADFEPRTFAFDVAGDTEALHVGIAFPPFDHDTALSTYDWQVRISDPSGREVASTEPDPRATEFGAAVAHVDLSGIEPAPSIGTWTAEVTGVRDLDMPEPTGDPVQVSVAVVQLKHQTPQVAPQPFRPRRSLDFRFDGGPAGELVSPEGCEHQVAEANGGLTVDAPDATCRSGAFVNDALFIDGGGDFVSQPLARATTVGGAATVRLNVVDEVRPMSANVANRAIRLEVDAVDDDGTLVEAVATEVVFFEPGTTPTLVEHELDVLPVDVPAGARLRVRVGITGTSNVSAATMRLLWAGEFADTGILLTTG